MPGWAKGVSQINGEQQILLPPALGQLGGKKLKRGNKGTVVLLVLWYSEGVPTGPCSYSQFSSSPYDPYTSQTAASCMPKLEDSEFM